MACVHRVFLCSLCGSLAIILATPSASGAEYFVHPTGSDEGPGSEESPWATIQHAANEAGPGDVVLVGAGTYFERVIFPRSGSQAGGHITFKAKPGARVVVDGSRQTVSGRQGLLECRNKSFLRVEGFVLQNFATSRRYEVPVGILIEGACRSLEIVGNEITGIASHAPVDEDLGGRDAHGLAVYGTEETPVSDLLVRDNEIHHLTLGSSEALVLNGNVERFRILANRVHHCDNIGIDLIGYEGTAPREELDQARDGIVAGNQVSQISTGANPAYGGARNAGGIYVDGARDVVLERNVVRHCDIGVEVASEHFGKETSGVAVRNNLIASNSMGGLFIGGYDEHTTGAARNCSITGNTFYSNDTDPSNGWYGQIFLQYRVIDCVFKNNILFSHVTKLGGVNPLIVHWNTTGTLNLFDHNLYFATANPLWLMHNTERRTWDSYREHAWSGPEERYANPEFGNLGAADFTPQSDAAVATADTSAVQPSERDLLGSARTSARGMNRGAVQTPDKQLDTLPLTIRTHDGVVVLSWPTRLGYFYDVTVWTGTAWATLAGADSLMGTGNEISWMPGQKRSEAIVRVVEH